MRIMPVRNMLAKEVMPIEKSRREIVVAEFISASDGDKPRPYGSSAKMGNP